MVHRLGTEVEGYLRVAAMSMAFYDALWTLPAEISIYRSQKSFKRMSRSCILFILIRYTSILVIVVGNIGFFYKGFTDSSCHKFFLLTPSFKVVQTMISQIIVAMRTVAVARRTRWVMWAVSIAFIMTVALEFFANIFARIPFREPEHAIHANCTSGNANGRKIVWVHYLAAMLYDITCLAIATRFIYSQCRKVPNHSIDNLSKMLFREGLLYFTYLTAANILNLVLYAVDSAEAQSAGATLGYVITWIMSQRLLIHLHEFKTNLCLPSPPPFNSQCKSSFYIAHQNLNQNPTTTTTREELELDVHVTIEESVKVDYDKDIAGGIMSQHRITTARIEREHRRMEERRKRERGEGVRRDEDSVTANRLGETDRSQATGAGKGWQVTSVGKIFSP